MELGRARGSEAAAASFFWSLANYHKQSNTKAACGQVTSFCTTCASLPTCRRRRLASVSAVQAAQYLADTARPTCGQLVACAQKSLRMHASRSAAVGLFGSAALGPVLESRWSFLRFSTPSDQCPSVAPQLPQTPVITTSHRSLRTSAKIRKLATEPRGH